MRQIYCDIIPHADGWCFVFEGRQSPAYSSYRLAVEAAQDRSRQGTRRSPATAVLRRQDLRGCMQEITGHAAFHAPYALFLRDRRA